MSHLFHNWPAESLSQIHADVNISPNREICANFYQLPNRLAFNPGPWLKRAGQYLLGDVESIDGVASIQLTSKLNRWLEQVRPQIVFSQMGGLWLTRLTNLIVQKLGIPLAVHISDDWIYDWPVNGLSRRNVFPFAQLLNRSCKQEFVQAIKSARLRYCISEAMCSEYKTRYGYEFQPLHNGVDPSHWPPKKIEQTANGQPFRLLYTGSITENGNLSSLKDIAEAVAALGSRGTSIKMEVATHTHGLAFREVIERSPWVEFTDMVPYAQLPDRLQEFDLLLLALNFDTISSAWLRYSLLGKVSEYMVSGTPVLLYGPRETTSVEYAASKNWGFVVTSPGRQNLEEALLRLIADAGLRRQLAETARQVALRDQDITLIRARFEAAMREAVAA